MTLEREFEIIKELGPAHLEMESRFCWVVVQDVTRLETDGSGVPLQGRGTNPYDAIHRHFHLLTGERSVLYVRHPTYRLVRWNEGQWTSVSAKAHLKPEDRDA